MESDNTFIIQDIYAFRNSPSDSHYFYLKDKLKELSLSVSDTDEVIICLNLFLKGANIKYQYETFTKEEHKQWVKYIIDHTVHYYGPFKEQRLACLHSGLKSN